MMLLAEDSVDAQSLISMSLRKIHNSRSERGGIKLHKNLLVSYVLRNARQLYLTERRGSGSHHNSNNNNNNISINNNSNNINSNINSNNNSRPHPPSIVGASVPGSGCAVGQPPPAAPPQPCSEPLCVCPANRDSHCTVLDLDTLTVTTVQTGFPPQDCPAPASCCCCCCGSSLGSPVSPSHPPGPGPAPPGPRPPPGPGRKRKCGSSGDPEDFSLPTVKRVRLETFTAPDPHPQHPGHISSLVSIFHAGFSGLVSRADSDTDCTDTDGDDEPPPLLQPPESAPAPSGQPCGKQALAGLGAWTRAIVAF